ncbi:Aryl-alcohol oxidase-like protein [Mycena chlorophos]|uniref:Aryl-alcohol oxidase-like protein n=1 Tax=Mycena chlorophos TaxID=658473 RepID=A0A8H6VXY2_MYCCL|nr:Aryl-alcohol oxidase-like protein [Mycena chlorophos]
MGKTYVSPDSDSEELEDKHYDFIVVGAGTAGGVVAARLSENPTFKVLVVEAGLSDDAEGSDVLRIPLFAGRASRTHFDWNYTTTPQPGLGGRAFAYPRGFVVGGCSNTNNLVYIRGPADDFDRIARVSGDAGWAWDNMKEYIQKNEQHVPSWKNGDELDFDSDAHGYGPLQTSLPAEPTELDRRVIETSKQLPHLFPFQRDLNSGDCLGVGWIHTTIGDGVRSSSSTAFLNPALATHDNLDLLIHTHVTRLLPTCPGSVFDFRKVVLAQAEDGPTFTLTAKKEVILCAGVIGTPQILQLSGIGPTDVLKQAGVPQLVRSPDVGQHLQDQPVVFYQWRVNEPTFSSLLRNPANWSPIMAEYADRLTGFAASPPFFNTMAFLRVPDEELVGMLDGCEDPAAGPKSAHFVFSWINTFIPNAGQPVPDDGDWISVAVVLESPMSAGSVNIKTASAFTHPAIDPAYFSSAAPFDMSAMITAFKTIYTFFSAPVWKDYLGAPSDEVAALTSDAAVESFIRKYATTIRHPVGTARIGRDGVLDSDLRVKNVEGVRVVDASVLPAVFEHVRWAPALRSYALPPEGILPFIRLLTLEGITYPFGDERFEYLDRRRIVTLAAELLPKLTAMHTFSLGDELEGGLWTELVEVLAAAPTLTYLALFSPWETAGTMPEPFRLSPRLVSLPLNTILYRRTLARSTRGPGIGRRTAALVELQGENLRRLTSACHASLEKLLIPGEHLLRAVDPDVDWSRLRTLDVQGLWPQDIFDGADDSELEAQSPSPEARAQTRILRLLEAMPNLRFISLELSVLGHEPEGATFLAAPHTLPPRRPEAFLRLLLEFTFCSLVANERILEFLPSGLEFLALARYPTASTKGVIRQPILRCSEMEQIFSHVDFPLLTSLIFWYRIQDLGDVDAERRLLELIPRAFPRLQTLVIHRLFNHDSPALRELWDPVVSLLHIHYLLYPRKLIVYKPRFRSLLSKLPDLRSFFGNFDDPQRHRKYRFRSIHDPGYHTHIERLSKLALDIAAQASPSLKRIAIYRELGRDDAFYWQYWDVVRGEDGNIVLPVS